MITLTFASMNALKRREVKAQRSFSTRYVLTLLLLIPGCAFFAQGQAQIANERHHFTAALEPPLSELSISDFLSGNQREVDVAGSLVAEYFFVWTSDGQDGSGRGIFGRRFTALGEALGPEFQINSYAADDQFMPAVGMDDAGNAIVIWRSLNQDGTVWGIFGQRFDSKGVKVGPEFQVNTPLNSYTSPWGLPGVDIAVSSTGAFVVVWASFDYNGIEEGVFAQRFHANGSPNGNRLKVWQGQVQGSFGPSVGMNSSGAFVVSWLDPVCGGVGCFPRVMARAYDPYGIALSASFQVDEGSDAGKEGPDIAMSPLGSAIVTWSTYTRSGFGDGSGFGVYARQVTPHGEMPGGEALVNSYLLGDQHSSRVATDGVGRFLIVWQSDGQDGDGGGIFGRRFGPDAAPLGDEFQLNVTNSGSQDIPAVASNEAGLAFVGWEVLGEGGDPSGIYGTRLGTGTELGLTQLIFGPISSPQESGTPFEVNITSVDAAGAVADYAGDIALVANVAVVEPLRLRLVNGKATASVTLDTGGDKVWLEAYAKGVYGRSNSFSVDGGPALTATVSGKVLGDEATTLSTQAMFSTFGSPGVEVHLAQEAGVLSTVTDSLGLFTFAEVACGQSSMWAEDPFSGMRSPSFAITSPCGSHVTHDLHLEAIGCNTGGVTPILLIPGIMGSSVDTTKSIITPYLPGGRLAYNDRKWGSGLSGLHDPFQEVGWRLLARRLREANSGYKTGCTIVPVPYDWRIPLEDAVTEYLIPRILEAKSMSPSGKVHVIAHSMGGLLVRQYIQSPLWKDDIDKFAMVGTPNHGSTLAYYLWEGGEPSNYIHMNASELQHEVFYGSDFRSQVSLGEIGRNERRYREEMLRLYHEHIPALQQLMPIYVALVPNGAPSVSFACEYGRWVPMENEWLAELNATVGNFLKPLGESGSLGVETVNFVSEGEATPTTVAVGSRRSINTQCTLLQKPTFYPDGTPTGLPAYSQGDGTVPKISSTLAPSIVESVARSDKGKHSQLIGNFTPELVSSIIGDEPGTTLPSATSLAAPHLTAADEVPAPALNAIIIGRPQPYLTDGFSQGVGIHPLTGDREEDIPGGTMSLDGGAASVSVNEILDGTYTLEIGSVHHEDYRLSLVYVNGSIVEEVEGHPFIHAAPVTYTITIDKTAVPALSLTGLSVSPTGLRAEPATGSVLSTALSWSPSPDPAVTGYNVYGKDKFYSKMRLLGSTTLPQFETGEPWAATEDDTVRIYSVTAVKADGTESFLSPSTKNDDRDYDGLLDYEETALGTDPTLADSDGDGIGDGDEQLYGTDPLLADTDGDGYSDGLEVAGGYDPLDPAWSPADLVLMNETWTASVGYEACNSITAGPFTVAAPTAAVELRAGARVVLRSGFSVEAGGSLVIRLDSSLGCTP